MSNRHFLGCLPPFFRKAIEYFLNQPHTFLEFAFAPSKKINDGAFLTAVLKCEKSQPRDGRGIGMIRNTKYSTSFFKHK
jgi:hypothetical protein